ncbi:hypothetical protein K2X33_15300 [bacterium]|nr:hypothetical protein [bacterium]
MEKQTPAQVDGYILELYRHGNDVPVYVSVFDQKADVGFEDYSESKEDSVVFECREALLPLASVEVEAIIMDGDKEVSAFDGFRILPFQGDTRSRLVTVAELEQALRTFEGQA